MGETHCNYSDLGYDRLLDAALLSLTDILEFLPIIKHKHKWLSGRPLANKTMASSMAQPRGRLKSHGNPRLEFRYAI